MTQWEYNTMSFEAVDSQALGAALGEFGKEGWELVGMTQFPIEKTLEVPATADTAATTKNVRGLVFVWVFKREVSRIRLPDGRVAQG